MTMQYGLGIIFETQLSHKTKRGAEVRGQKPEIRGQALLNLDFGMWRVGDDIKRRAQSLRLKSEFPFFALNPEPCAVSLFLIQAAFT
jgi:hypothetical protein